MGDTTASLIRHAAIAACLGFLLVRPALAQGPGVEGGEATIPPAPAAPTFMSRADFHLAAAAISTDDPRFKWDTHFGGDLDVVDYGAGRIRTVIDYQAVLGNEYRPFDPNQGNYILEPSASVRIAGWELAGVFHHESRHLSDRPKRFAVAWNTLEGRILKRLATPSTVVEVEAGFGKIVQHSYVDYDWVGDLDLLVRHRMSPHADVYLRGTGALYGVTGGYENGLLPRDNQRSGRAEIGLRLAGRAGAIELFAGAERMVDPYPVVVVPSDATPMQWTFAGFRLVSR